MPSLTTGGKALADIPSPRVLLSSSQDPYDNLVYEEILLAGLRPGEEILLLSVNQPAVVLGRFQNPWQECRPGLAQNQGVSLCRRISGGGTVVHDQGNLNLSFLSGESRLQKEENLDKVIQALSPWGLSLRQNHRFDLLAVQGGEERKISGSAFRKLQGRSLHHATLLISSDLSRIGSLLGESSRQISTRGISSRPSPVVNLGDLAPALTVEQVIESLTRRFSGTRSLVTPSSLPGEEGRRYRELRRERSSFEWVLGRTPPFTETFPPLPGGESLTFEVRKGCIVKVHPSRRETAFLLGLPYQGGAVLQAAPSSFSESALVLARWIDGTAPASPPFQEQPAG